MCISLEFIKKDSFVKALKDLYKCVSLSNSSRKTHFQRGRKSGRNVYLCRIHQERYICTGRERAVQMCISVQRHQERHICTGAEIAVQIYVQIHQERHICTGAERAVQICISVRIYQERHNYTDAERTVQMCISLEYINKDTFVQTQKELYKCVSLSNSSRKRHLFRRRKSCTDVYLCRIHQERHTCTGAERALQMCISVEFIKKDTFVQVQKELYKCVSPSEFIKKDTFLQAQKELYKCVSLTNSSRKTHLYRRRKS